MSTANQNPYVGPRTFEANESHLFFGREREALDLLSLVISERLVLFYAQSGAGKSSLINTKLIPGLEAEGEFQVLPVARVGGGDAFSGSNAQNIFVYNLVAGLLPHNVNPDILNNLVLAEYVSSNLADMQKPGWKQVLIIDQFEELFSTHLNAWEKREDFFKQLAQAMADFPSLWVVLVMREDYIAYLDPYVNLLPGKLRVRYYMQRLEREAALKAIKKPVEQTRPFADDVAGNLVADLAGIKIQKPDGTTITQPGQFIEPVQLQVVCYNLWESLPADGNQITSTDLQKLGDVNQALEKHYEKRVKEVAEQKKIKERMIREWFANKLITSNGMRSMALQETRKKDGDIPDEVIRALQSDLVRAEKRGEVTFYELTHDRLVEPILESNKKWFEENSSPLQRQAALWNDQGQSDNWLLSDKALKAVEEWAGDHPNELTKIERDFLQACRVKQEERNDINRARSARRQRYLLTGARTALIIMCFLLMSALQSRSKAQTAASTAQAAAVLAQAAESNAKEARSEAEVNANLAFARQLAAQSIVYPKFDLALLLSIEAGQLANASDVQNSLFTNLRRHSEPFAFLNEHDDLVESVAFSPNGKLIASGSDDDRVIIWNSDGNRYISKASTDCGCAVESVTFSPDSQLVAAGTHEKIVLLSDLESDSPETFELPTIDWVHSVAFSPDGNFLVGGGCHERDDQDNCLKGEITIWDVKSRQMIGQPIIGHTGSIHSIAFNSDGKILASSSHDDDTIVLWNLENPENPQLLSQFSTGHQGNINTVAFSPDDKLLASGSDDNDIIIWDVGALKELRTLAGHAGDVRSLVFSPDGKMLASGSEDHTIRLWDVSTGFPIEQPLLGHTLSVYSVDFSPDGKKLVSGGADNSVILWSITPRMSLNTFIAEDSGSAGGNLGLGYISQENEHMLVVGKFQGIDFWSLGNPPSVNLSLPGPVSWVNRLTISSDGSMMATSSCALRDDDGNCIKGELIIWDLEPKTPTIKFKLLDHAGWITDLQFSPDDKWLATGSWFVDEPISLWNTQTGQQLDFSFPNHEKVRAIAFASNSNLMAIAPYDGSGTIDIWNLRENPPVLSQILTDEHTGSVSRLAFSPDGKILVSGGYDRKLVIWDIQDPSKIVKIQSLSEHTGAIYAIAFSPDGKMFASGGSDNSVILWDVVTRKAITKSVADHNNYLTFIVFSPDSKNLVSMDADGLAVISSVDHNSWLFYACEYAGRNLTLNEWLQYFPNEIYRATCPQYPLESKATPTTVP